MRLAALVFVTVLSTIALPAGAQVPISSQTLSVSDLPAEYSTVLKNVSSLATPCAELYIPTHIGPRVVTGFEGTSSDIEEGLVQLSRADLARSLFGFLDHHYSECKKLHPIGRLKINGTGRRISFPNIGEQSQAFFFSLTVNHTPINTEVILFRQGAICGEVIFLGLSPVDRSEMDSVALRAAEKTLVGVTS